jgi:molecular chaperone GrpE
MTKKLDKKEQQIKELEEKIADLTSGWQRTQADFVNYKKQSADERAKLIASASSDLIYDFLPVLDHFQLAAKHLPTDLEKNDWAIGIQHIEKQLEMILSENGLERIAAVGIEFDPNIHEAIEEIESDEADGIIVEEILSGYKFNDKVLRPAKVKVSKNPPTN